MWSRERWPVTRQRFPASECGLLLQLLQTLQVDPELLLILLQGLKCGQVLLPLVLPKVLMRLMLQTLRCGHPSHPSQVLVLPLLPLPPPLLMQMQLQPLLLKRRLSSRC